MKVRGMEGLGVVVVSSQWDCGGRGVKFRNRGGVSRRSMPSASACRRSFSGDFGGVTSSSSRCLAGSDANPDGADDKVSDNVSDMVLPSPLTLSMSSEFDPFFFLRFTTRWFRLRPPWAFPCLFEPSPSPVAADPKLVRLGLAVCDGPSEPSGNT